MNTPFQATTKAEWLAQVQKDIKDPGAAVDLPWQTPDGFSIDPYFTADDLALLPLTAIQAPQKQEPGWLNTPSVRVEDDTASNPYLRDGLTRGANAWLLQLVNADTDLPRLLHGIKLSDTPLFFETAQPAELFIADLQRAAPYQLRGGLLNDPLANWMTTSTDWQHPVAALAEATRLLANSPRFTTICTSSHVFHNAGATATQELAFLLANLAHQYDLLTDAGLTIDQLVAKTTVSVSVGTSYFAEIAKLRALRIVFQQFVSCYRPQASAPTLQYPFVHAQTSTFYDAAVTPNTNLLRATTEAMAAIIGGCDALTVHGYDAVFRQPDGFSERIARNVSLLLDQESYLNKVADPSAGSYYIETLTHQLTKAAWALFLAVEQQGGLVRAFEAGSIQAQIEEAYQAKVKAIQQGGVLVGVNKYRVDEEPVGGQTETSEAVGAPMPLLQNRRLAREFEG